MDVEEVVCWDHSLNKVINCVVYRLWYYTAVLFLTGYSPLKRIIAYAYD